MSKHFGIRLICGGVVASAMLCAAPVVQAATPAGGGNVAPWVAKARKVGTASDSTTVTLAVHLALSNAAALKELVADVSVPGTPEYGRYLTVQEFGQRFAPARTDVAAVEKLLESVGMSEVQAGPHGAYVTARATVGQLRTAFHVSQDLYLYQGRTLRANREEPTLPSALAGKVLYIEGLDESTALRHPFHRSATFGEVATQASAHSASSAPGASTEAAGSAAPLVTPPPVAAGIPSPYCNTYYGSGQLKATLSTAADVYGAEIPWLNCGYTPQQIRTAYGLSAVKYDGAGVTIAITDAYASPTIFADANRYAVNHKLPPLTSKNFSQIVPVGIYDVSPGEACQPYGWWGEESLDVAAVHGAAPGANIVYIGSRDCNASLTVALLNAVYNHTADVVTNSWGDNGEGIAPGDAATFDQAMLAGAAQGVTVLFSSGDAGDLAAINGVASGSWPATSSYVTSVGGTTLFVKDMQGTKSEYGWGTYRDFLTHAMVHSAKSITTSGVATVTNFGVTFDDFQFYTGSGGGISLIEQEPAYQASVVPKSLATTLNTAGGYSVPLPNPQRVTPDVAMVADPYTGYLIGETFTIAGNKYADAGCTPLSKTEEYCEIGFGGTSLASPLMAGVVAVLDQKRKASGEPVVGFANPLFYGAGSHGRGNDLTTAVFNQITAPPQPTALLRGYANDPTRVRVITVNSVPTLYETLTAAAPFVLTVCGLPICEGIDEVYNFTSWSPWGGTPAGYNDVTGLGVPFVPKLLNE